MASLRDRYLELLGKLVSSNNGGSELTTSFEANERFESPILRLKAARAVVSSTQAGSTGAIRVEMAADGQRVEYVSNLSGIRFKTLNEAEMESSGSAIARFSVVSPRDVDQTQFFATNPSRILTRRGSMGSQTAIMARNFKDMLQTLETMDPNSEQYALLERAGVNVGDLLNNNPQMTLMTRSARELSKTAAGEQVGRSILIAAEANQYGRGLSVVKDGLRTLGIRYRTPGDETFRYLTSAQINLLQAMTGFEFMNPDVFDKLVTSGDSQKMASKLMKIAKRFVGPFSERQFSLEGQELGKFLGIDTLNSYDINAEIMNKVLLKDLDFEVLRTYLFSLQADVPGGQSLVSTMGSVRNRAERALYEQLEVSDYIDPAKRATGLTTADEEILRSMVFDQAVSPFDSALGKEARVYDNVSKKWRSDTLSDLLQEKLEEGKNNKSISDDAYDRLSNFIKGLMDTSEKAIDGEDIYNTNYVKNYITEINNEINEMSKLAADNSLSPLEKDEVINRITELSRAKRSAQNMLKNPDQITGRVSLPDIGSPKNVFAMADFDPRLNNFAAVINKHSVKNEFGMVRNMASMALSGIPSRHSANVFTDYLAVAFHGDIFASDEIMKATEQRANYFRSKFVQSIESNVLDPSIRKILVAQAEAADNIENLSPQQIGAVQRMSREAAEILEYVDAGYSLKSNTGLIQTFGQIMSRQIYREQYSNTAQRTYYQTVVPNFQRYAVGTEETLLGRNIDEGYEINKIILRGKNKTREVSNMVLNEADEVFQFSEARQLEKFRVMDHKVLFAQDFVTQYMDALGGFDLDDKGLPILTTYREKVGNDIIERVAFSTMRTPTGPKEIIFLTPSMDTATVNAIFKNEMFDIAYSNAQDRLNHLLGVSDPTMDTFDEIAKLQDVIGKFSEIEAFAGGDFKFYEEGSQEALKLEQAILDTYRYQSEVGLNTLVRFSDQRIRDVEKFGSAYLKSAPGEEAGYSSIEGVMKILDEEGAFETRHYLARAMSDVGFTADEIMQVTGISRGGIDLDDAGNVIIKQTGIEDYESIAEAQKADIVGGKTYQTSIDEVYANLGKFIDYDTSLTGAELNKATLKAQMARAALSETFSIYSMNSIFESGNLLGVYINRLSAVANSIDVYGAALNTGALDSSYLDFLKSNITIPLYSPEGAIDPSVNAGGIRKIQQTVANLAMENPTLNQEGITRAIAKIHGLQNDARFIANRMNPTMGIDLIGAIAMEESTGKIVALLKPFEEQLGMSIGIDKSILQTRNPADMKLVAASFIEGVKVLEEYNATAKVIHGNKMNMYSRQAEELIQTLSKYKDLTSFDDSGRLIMNTEAQLSFKKEKALQADLEKAFESYGIFLPENDPLAYYGRTISFTEGVADVMKSTVDSSIKRAKTYRDPALARLYLDSSMESRAVAKKIYDESFDKLDMLSQMTTKMREQALEYDSVYAGESIAVANEIMDSLVKYSRMENVSRYEVLRILDYMMTSSKVDLKNLKYITDTLSGFNEIDQMYGDISLARRLTAIDAARRSDVRGVGSELAQKLIDKGLRTKEQDGIKEFMEEIMSKDPSVLDDLTDYERQILENMAGTRTGVTDEILDRLSSTTKANISYELEKEEFERIRARTPGATADPGIEDLLENVADDVDPSDPATRRAKFVSLADKIQEKEFRALMNRPGIKSSLAGLAALVVGSIAYQNSKDRTQEDMAGPPLLPGGSAYEEGLPSRIPDLPFTQPNQIAQGISYKVSLIGNPEMVRKFKDQASGLTNGDFSTTMYNSLPMPNLNDYQSMMSDY